MILLSYSIDRIYLFIKYIDYYSLGIYRKFNMSNKNAKEKSKPTSNQPFYQDQRVELPPNFAQEVMELEMQLQFIETYNMEVVQQLNELYRVAVEYYINEDPRKANHFQKKLTSLLTHPHTLELIQKKPIPAKHTSTDHSQYSSHLKMELNKFNTSSEIVVKSIIEGSEKKIEKTHRLMNEHIESQEDKLKRRLEQRSRSKKREV